MQTEEEFSSLFKCQCGSCSDCTCNKVVTQIFDDEEGESQTSGEASLQFCSCVSSGGCCSTTTVSASTCFTASISSIYDFELELKLACDSEQRRQEVIALILQAISENGAVKLLKLIDQQTRLFILVSGGTILRIILQKLNQLKRSVNKEFKIIRTKKLYVLPMKITKGFKCEGCVGPIRDAINSQPGVHYVNCDVESKEVTAFGKVPLQAELIIKTLNKMNKEVVVLNPEHMKFPKPHESTHTIHVNGMKCGSCVQTIEEGLSKISGVTSVQANLKEKTVKVGVSNQMIDESIFVQAIKELGFKPVEIKELSMDVDGMKCGSCSEKVTTALTALPSVTKVDVKLKEKKVAIKYKGDGKIAYEQAYQTFYEAIKGAGFRPKLLEANIEFPLSPVKQPSAPVILEQPSVPMEVIDISDEGRGATNQILIENSNKSNPIVLSEDMKKLAISIQGMSCASCVNKIERGVLGITGVATCNVNLIAQKGDIIYNSSQVDENKIVNYVSGLGFEASAIIEDVVEEGHVRLSFTNISDSGEISEVLNQIDGVQEVNFGDGAKKKTSQKAVVAEIKFDEHQTCPRIIIDRLKQKGVEAQIFKHESGEQRAKLMREQEIKTWRGLFIFSSIFTYPALVAMIFDMIPVMMQLMETPITRGLSYKNLFLFLFATPVQFIGGFKFYVLALKSLKHFIADMNTLITIAAWLAYGYSVFAVIWAMSTGQNIGGVYFETASSLIMFLLLGRWLENIAKSKTSQALVNLMDLQPTAALLIDFQDPAMREKVSKALANTENINELQVNEFLQKGQEREIELDLVSKGDLLKVLPGATVPVDGIVVYGTSSVNESLLTGESLPQDKRAGSEVIGGTINVDGYLVVKATRVGQNSTLSSIAKLVEQAQTQKPNIQALADRISGIFVPAVILLALLVFVLWSVLGFFNLYPASWRPAEMQSHDDPRSGEPMNPFVFALLMATSTVIVACPCALGLATPTALMVGTGVGAKKGVLIKGGKVLELTRSAKAICFDKTGTLTKGMLLVNKMVPFTNFQATSEFHDDTLSWIAAAEQASEHPIARAIHAYCVGQISNFSEKHKKQPTNFTAVPGRGVKCSVDDHTIHIGNKAFMREEGVNQKYFSREHETTLDEYAGQGNSLVYVSVDNYLALAFALSDTVKDESLVVVSKLQKMGLQVYMLTGDNSKVAHHIASQVGIPEDHVFAELTPAGKADIVKQLQSGQLRTFELKSKRVSKRFKTADGEKIDDTLLVETDEEAAIPNNKKEPKHHGVIMVGDGINDSPSLAQADIGIAVAEASDVAMECADIVLMSNKNALTSVVTAIDLARTTYRRIILNFVWAFAYNLIAIPIAAGALFPFTKMMIPSWVAGLAMVLSSISVLTSSLLLNFYRPPKVL